jgi:hypothetical protein
MRVMVIINGNANSEAGKPPSERALTEMMKFNEELVKAGVMLSGEGLQPTSKSKRIRFSGRTRTVIDGPFSETKELIAGFWLWQVKSMDEAVEWVKRIPNPDCDDGDVDIRPVFETADFGAELTPEMREKDAQLRAQLARPRDS